MAGDIRELPQNARDTLRSTFIIQTLPSCIVELVHNALDAQATAIEVAVSVANWECRVTDNGHGIDARSLGLLGRRHHTSKHRGAGNAGQADLYGHRGEDMALVEVITRHSSSTDTFTAILRGSETLYVGPAKHGHRSCSGTTIIVRDLFYKWPVRRKEADNASNYQNTTLSQIRKNLEALAIINHTVAFQLHDLDRQDATASASFRLFHTTSTKSVADCIANLYSRRLVEHISHIDYSDIHCTMSGFISLMSTHNKQTQFIYVNRRPITTSELHRQINHLFDRSAFARRAEVDERRNEREMSPRPTTYLSKTASPRKTVSRFPAFCLCLEVSTDKVDFFQEPNKQVAHFQDEESISKAIKDVVTALLQDYGFLDTAAKTGSSPIKPVSSPVHMRVKRIKAAAPRPRTVDVPDLPAPYIHLPAVSNRIKKADQILAASRSPTVSSGNVPTTSSSPESRESRNKPVQVVDVRHLKRSDEDSESSQKPMWLAEALKGWKNPVFMPLRKPIRSVQAQSIPRLENFHTEAGYDGARYRLDKEMLHWCSFVAQIDCKFLLYTCSGQNETTLLLVDQHAADERIRVEAFLREYCEQYQRDQVARIPLLTAKGVLLTAREANEAHTYVTWLARWGFEIEEEIASNTRITTDFGQIMVKAVPKLLADRLESEDRLLQTIVRALLSHAEVKGIGAQHTQSKTWTTVMKDMPAALIELVNSKACRGAIMFKDKLQDMQCQALLSSLAETDFPFSCAHGRPSMMPLVHLPDVRHSHRNKRASLDWDKVRSLSERS